MRAPPPAPVMSEVAFCVTLVCDSLPTAEALPVVMPAVPPDAFEASPRAGSVFLVRYERLFDGDERTRDAMFAFLGLEVTPEVEHQFRGATAHWDEHVAKPLALAPNQIDELTSALEASALGRFDAAFDAQLMPRDPA